MFKDFIFSLPHEDRLKIASRQGHFIAQCKFKEDPNSAYCSEKAFEVTASTDLGICFSFNYYPPDKRADSLPVSGGQS